MLAILAPNASLAGPGGDCPPDAEPGKCYEKVYLPALYEAYVEQEPEQAAGDGATSRQRQVPTAMRPVTRQRRIREASFDWREVACLPDARAGARTGAASSPDLR